MSTKYYGPRPVTGPTVAAIVVDKNSITIRVVEKGDLVAPGSKIKADDNTAAKIASAAREVARRIAPVLAAHVSIIEAI